MSMRIISGTFARILVAIIALGFANTAPVRADEALDGFKVEITSLEGYIQQQEAILKTDPMAGINMIRGIISRLYAVKTDRLPADLKQGFTEFVVSTARMGELFKDWPNRSEDMQSFIAKKIGADPKYMETFDAKMKAIEIDMQPATKKLDELGRKYGIDGLGGIAPG